MGYFQACQDLDIPVTITGVDIEPQKNYPFNFVQANALKYVKKHGHKFDFIHASPNCQGYSATRFIHGKKYTTDIEKFRELLVKTGKPFVIENVPGSPLKNYLMLCGTMFGLKVIRHRHFECSPEIYFPPALCNHYGKTNSNRGFSAHKNGADFITVAGCNFSVDDAREAMEINWMKQKELAQAIPPAYTRYIGNNIFPQIVTI
jgi:DNA (cytosine-5)-methyltransferase 1